MLELKAQKLLEPLKPNGDTGGALKRFYFHLFPLQGLFPKTYPFSRFWIAPQSQGFIDNVLLKDPRTAHFGWKVGIAHDVSELGVIDVLRFVPLNSRWASRKPGLTPRDRSAFAIAFRNTIFHLSKDLAHLQLLHTEKEDSTHPHDLSSD
jgi:hypothetical protein